MYGRIGWLIFSILMLCFVGKAFSQSQDVDFHINTHLLSGKKILKVKRDFYDPYLWVLSENNGVYRVNSLTLVVDDYTSKFAAYNTLQFIDIAGRSKDTVFVAANSTDVIEYKNGSLRDIGLSRGLTDVVNSIGVTNNGLIDQQNLLIGTNHGLGTYGIVSDILNYRKYQYYTTGPVQILANTYRSQMLTGDDPEYDTPPPYPVVFTTAFGSYESDVLHMVESGNQINTGFYTYSDAVQQTIFAGSFFWGNKNGMFQESLHYSGDDPTDFAQFLNNIKVNKITDIFGLASLYSYNIQDNLLKDDLLIGTDNGFYFSSTINKYYTGLDIAAFSISHFDALGSLPVNDVCVNTTGYNGLAGLYTLTNCENAVWLGTNDGVYVLNPDYGKYLGTSTKINAVSVDGPLTQPVTTLSLCQGATLIPQINGNLVTGNSIQWVKNGSDIVGATQSSLQITNAGEYWAILYDACENIHIETNHLIIQVTAGPVFSFNYPDDIQQCGTAPFALKTDDNPGYQYRWYTNGVLNGNTTSSYTATQSGKYKVEVSACTNSWVPSKEVEVDMITLPTPQISPDKQVYCAEDVATLSENAPVDATYTINWYLNGTILPADANLTSISTTTPGTYTVTLTGTVPGCSQTSSPFQLQFTPAPTIGMFPAEARACNSETLEVLTPGGNNLNYTYRWYTNGVLNGSTGKQIDVTETAQYRVEASTCPGSWVSSNTIQADIVNLPPISVITTDKPYYCTGDNATLSLPISADPSYTINWYLNKTLVQAYSNQTSFTTNVAGSYTASVVNNAKNYDGTYCTETTSAQAISFDPATAISIEKSAATSLCDGQTVNLSAHYSGGTITWSTGQTTDQIAVIATGTYTATVTSPNGCTSTATADITFLPAPALNISNASVCSAKKQPVTLVAPSGYVQYTWNGQAGTSTYQVNTAQKVTLTVTDANGCQATQQVIIADDCPDLIIPNTFTPNNDNINDYWVIEGVQNNTDLRVRIFNRYGAKLYDNVGYGTPWNGEYGGKKVPAGVYYYLINVPSKNKTYSGPITVLY